MDVLEDVADGPAFAASLREELVEAGIKRIKPSQLDDADKRPMAELTAKLHTIQTINALSHRCDKNRDHESEWKNRDHESEWNNRVHTKVLELALGNDEARVGFRTVVAAKIASEFRPTHSPGLTTGRIVDYAMFLEPSRPAHDAITSLVPTWSDSINHISYEALRTRPIAISIETKTESRTVEEAKVQLGVWLAGQVARIEALIQQIAVSEQFEHEEERSGANRRALHPHMHMHPQQSTPTPTINSTGADPTALLSRIVFPLLDVQSDTWSLFFGRVSPDTSTSMSGLNVRKPASHIHIFHSIPLGNTANMAQTYRLVKSLKALRTWIDVEFRMWWDRVLGIDGGDGD